MTDSKDPKKRPQGKPEQKPQVRRETFSDERPNADKQQWIGESKSQQDELNKAFEVTPRPTKPKK